MCGVPDTEIDVFVPDANFKPRSERGERVSLYEKDVY